MMRKTPLRRTGFARTLPGVLRVASTELAQRAVRTVKPKKRMKSNQRPVSPEEKVYWSRLAGEIGCIACHLDGNTNQFVSIHHIDGRTKIGCHKKVLPICAGHHQDGTGEDKTMIAIHPWFARFEARYGSQMDLNAMCNQILGVAE